MVFIPKEVIFLVGSWANLVPNVQNLLVCRQWNDPDPVSGIFDPTKGLGACSAGVAKIDAFRRAYVGQATLQLQAAGTAVKSQVISRLVTLSAFVQMHPKQWAINKDVLHDMLGWKLFVHTPSLLYQNKVDYPVSLRDLTPLQDEKFPFLLSNVVVPPSHSWHPYLKSIYWDHDTRCAYMTVAATGDPATIDALAAIQGSLTYIFRVNERNGCFVADLTATPPTGKCWIPVVLLTDSPSENPLVPFVNALNDYAHPPSLIVGVEVDPDTTPKYPTPALQSNNQTWAISYWMDEFNYYHFQLDMASQYDTLIHQVTYVTHPLAGLPVQAMDDAYKSHITQIGNLINQALIMDRVIGYTADMPDPRIGDNYRACQAGPCEVASLFADALRWYSPDIDNGQAPDVAFITSGGVRDGWTAGAVKVQNLWAALPFPNTLCRGTMTGISLFRVLEYSTRVATYDVRDAPQASDLLQVSGIQVRYNSQLGQGVSKILSVDIWNSATLEWQPLERLKLYTFATDSFVCTAPIAEPFPTMLGPLALQLPGEVPAKVHNTAHHRIVEEFLVANHASPETAYQPELAGRVVDHPGSNDPVINLIQSAETCQTGTQHWVEEQQTCQACPDTSVVVWFKQEMDFQGVSGKSDLQSSQIELVNGASFPVTVSPKSFPSWLVIDSVTAKQQQGEDGGNRADTGNDAVVLATGQRLALDFSVSASTLEPGTALGTVSFGIVATTSASSGATDALFVGCSSADASFDVLYRATPPSDANYLGSLSWIGWSLAVVVLISAFACAMWVIYHRQQRAVMTMQPLFLVTICVGIAILGTALIPLGVDDEKASDRGCDIACMATPWLLSIGFSITFSALFSKLWRINRLFNATRFQRLQVKERDVLLPFVIIFGLNIVTLLLLTLLDPLQWERRPVSGQSWNTFGSCKTDGAVGNSLLGVLGAINASALIAACYQAYRARNLSDEFSESKPIGIALYSWLQLVLVGVPIVLLLDDDSVDAVYFMYTALIFAISMSMLVLIFYPVVMNVISPSRGQAGRGSNVHVSGLHGSHSTGTSPYFQKDQGRPGRSGVKSSLSQSGSNQFDHGSGSLYVKRTDDDTLRDEFDLHKKDSTTTGSSRGTSSHTESSSSEAEPVHQDRTTPRIRRSELESIEEGKFVEALSAAELQSARDEEDQDQTMTSIENFESEPNDLLLNDDARRLPTPAVVATATTTKSAPSSLSSPLGRAGEDSKSMDFTV